MKAEDVMRALELCKDRGCNNDCPCWNNDIPREWDCRINLMNDVLALLREKDAEIERLREKAVRNLENLKAVLEEREERNEKTIVADTVSEFQTKVAMRYGTYTDKDMTPITEVFRLLDQIAKEMLEGNKCSSDVKENCKYYGSDGVELSEEWLASREIIVKSADGYGYT